jgi:serine/threonine protein kinase
MDFLNGGELFFHLRKETKFSERRACFYAAQLVEAIRCLHTNGVIYRDLKPENVLLD